MITQLHGEAGEGKSLDLNQLCAEFFLCIYKPREKGQESGPAASWACLAFDFPLLANSCCSVVRSLQAAAAWDNEPNLLATAGNLS